MKIGIDARPLQAETQYRGIGKALEFFLSAFSVVLPAADSCVFYVDRALPIPEVLAKFPTAKTIHVATSRLGRTRYIRSVLPSYPLLSPKKRDVDVVLQYDATLGVPKSVPTVTVFHDMIPLLFRGQERRKSAKGLRKAKNELAGQMYWRKYLRTLKQYKNSRKIIAISSASKNDLLSHVSGIKPLDVHVVHHGVDKTIPSNRGVSAKIKEIATTPYLLYVGGIDLRKNVVGLIKTFYSVKEHFPDLKLVTVGKEFGLNDQLGDLGWFTALDQKPAYKKDVIFPGFVSHEDLFYLYQHAEVFVFPSRYEGFGLPILEAMQAGCPVVAYSNSSIPEVAGEAAVLVQDNTPLAPAVQDILTDPAMRKDLITKGQLQAQKFTWDKTARKTLAVLHEAVN